MPFELVTVPCLSDNYAFLAHDHASGKTLLVDAPEARPIIKALADRGWILSDIILTHHHLDHVQGLNEILSVHSARVIGALADKNRLPPLDVEVSENDRISVGTQTGRVFDVSGHTIGHIAVYFEDSKLLFTADSLMALGCGRLFEGSAEQMWESLSKLANLDPETKVCSGHEYTIANGRFALTIEPQNAKLQNRIKTITNLRAKGAPTVPSVLLEELETNPFLRPKSENIRKNLKLQNASETQVFAEIRSRKDNF